MPFLKAIDMPMSLHLQSPVLQPPVAVPTQGRLNRSIPLFYTSTHPHQPPYRGYTTR
jgi:hypothetical protein